MTKLIRSENPYDCLHACLAMASGVSLATVKRVVDDAGVTGSEVVSAVPEEASRFLYYSGILHHVCQHYTYHPETLSANHRANRTPYLMDPSRTVDFLFTISGKGAILGYKVPDKNHGHCVYYCKESRRYFDPAKAEPTKLLGVPEENILWSISVQDRRIG